jgi:hypothetical protein
MINLFLFLRKSSKFLLVIVKSVQKAIKKRLKMIWSIINHFYMANWRTIPVFHFIQSGPTTLKAKGLRKEHHFPKKDLFRMEMRMIFAC